jgi:hypothetical protein
MKRPSKRSGFCFKIWHPLETSIWTQKANEHDFNDNHENILSLGSK